MMPGAALHFASRQGQSLVAKNHDGADELAFWFLSLTLVFVSPLSFLSLCSTVCVIMLSCTPLSLSV